MQYRVLAEKLKEAAASVLPVTAIVAVLCLALVRVDVGLMLSFLLGSGLLSIILYCFFLLGKRNVPASEISGGKLSFAPFLKVVRNPYSWVILYCATVNFAIYFIIQTVFGKKFLEDFTGMSSSKAAACIFSLTCVCMAVLFTSSMISRLMRNRRKPLILFSTALCLLNTILMTLAIYFEFNGTVFAVCYLLYAVASGFSVIFSMSEQEVNSPDTMTQATGFINMINYLAVAVFSILVGILLDSFGGQQVNGAVIYSKQAYLTLFLLMNGGYILALLFACVRALMHRPLFYERLSGTRLESTTENMNQ